MKNFDSTRIKQIFSFLTVVFLAMYAYGVQFGMPLFLACFGIRQMFASKGYFANKNKMFAYLSLCMGIFLLICSIIILIGMLQGA